MHNPLYIKTLWQNDKNKNYSFANYTLSTKQYEIIKIILNLKDTREDYIDKTEFNNHFKKKFPQFEREQNDLKEFIHFLLEDYCN